MGMRDRVEAVGRHPDDHVLPRRRHLGARHASRRSARARPGRWSPPGPWHGRGGAAPPALAHARTLARAPGRMIRCPPDPDARRTHGRQPPEVFVAAFDGRVARLPRRPAARGAGGGGLIALLAAAVVISRDDGGQVERSVRGRGTATSAPTRDTIATMLGIMLPAPVLIAAG